MPAATSGTPESMQRAAGQRKAQGKDEHEGDHRGQRREAQVLPAGGEELLGAPVQKPSHGSAPSLLDTPRPVDQGSAEWSGSVGRPRGDVVIGPSQGGFLLTCIHVFVRMYLRQ